jgi:heme/copper-type cytochrome/quinol oxidase subunit 3
MAISIIWPCSGCRWPWREAYTASSRLGVELCAVYWHFLLLVWLLLFGLMLVT